ncbi:MAG: ATP phosphoribosyltransferase regulatory subunit [Spirochaetaceae bacterium]
MTAQFRRALQVPQGTEGFYLEEAYRHRRLAQTIERIFLRWGYLPVQTPSFDFYDVYTPLLRDEDAKRIYRLIDREGDLLMLRSDITLFLAKQMGLILRAEDLPTRVFYADTILRHEDPEDISKNEFFQTGAELIGKPGTEADAEVVLLLQEVLADIGITRYFLHLGCRSLLDASLPPASVAEGERREAARAVRLREWHTLEDALGDAGRSPEEIRALSSLYRFIGTPKELDALLESVAPHLNPGERSAITEVRRLYDLLDELDATSRLRLDFSEVGNQPYHTGVAFEVYLDGLDSAVAAGGRYDGLLSVFGLDAPSVGFSMMLRKIRDQLELNSELSDPPQAEQAPGRSFTERVRSARTLRREGRTAIL